MTKRIGIYGGAFNPPTLGHTHVINSVMDAEDFDELWVVPSYIHYHGKEMAPFDIRLKMCEKAFGKMVGIKVVDIERSIATLEYEYDGSMISMLENLRKHQDDDFHIIIGQDNADSIETWKDGDVLIKNEKFVVIPRPETPDHDGLYTIDNEIGGCWYRTKELTIFMGGSGTGKTMINKWYFRSPHNVITDASEVLCSSTMAREQVGPKGSITGARKLMEKSTMDLILYNNLYNVNG